MADTIATSVFLFGGLPAGMLVDRFGPVTGAVVAGSSMCLSSLALGLLPASADYLYALPFALLAAGGSMTFFSSMKVAFILPHLQITILAAVNVLFDVSAGFPLLFYTLYSLGISRATVFSAYGGYTVVLYASWAMLFFRQISKAPPLPASSNAEATQAANKKPIEVILPIDPDCTLVKALASRQFLMPFFGWYLVHQVRCNLYLGSAKYMLRALGDTDDTFMAVFTTALSSAAFFVSPAGSAPGQHTPAVSLSA